MTPKTFSVGGSVRDKLMNRLVHDEDFVVVGATHEYMIENGYKKVGADFPVYLKNGQEYALARTERKTGVGYNGFDTRFDPSVTLTDDLQRRDLTCNSLAQDLETGEIFDPFAGQSDIKAKRLRHVSEAFREDPVRVLRLARFMAKFGGNWHVAPSTVELCKDMVESGELNHLTKERVWKEFEKCLTGIFAPEKFLKTLKECNALKVVFPLFDKNYDLVYRVLLDNTYRTPTPKSVSRNVFNFAIIMQHFLEPKIYDFCKLYKIPNDYRDYAIKFKRVSEFDIHVQPSLYVDFLQNNGFYQSSDHTILDRFGASIRTRYLQKACDLTIGYRFADIPVEVSEKLVGKAITEYINYKRKNILSDQM